MTDSSFARGIPIMTRNPNVFRPRLESLEDRATPATFTVNTPFDVVNPSDDRLSLREAIGRANNHDGPDTIVVPAGLYRITFSGAGENLNATGDFDVRESVTIRGAGAGLTVVDGQSFDRVFDVFGSTVRAVFEKLTVRGGDVTGDGGGVWVGGSDVVVRDCVITRNRASGEGGGIGNTVAGSGDLTLVRTTVARNAAGVAGGGVSITGVASSLTIKSSTIRRNLATTHGGGVNAATAIVTASRINGNIVAGGSVGGGGIFTGQASLTDCTISGNSANNGGGVRASIATLTRCTVSGNAALDGTGGGVRASGGTLTACTISGNTAVGNGGGVFGDEWTLNRCTISGNTASLRGGGLTVGGTVTNTTISGNSAGLEGGGMYVVSVALLNCTVVENVAPTGGGIFHAAFGTVTVRNTIIALNLAGVAGTGPDISGAFTSEGHNLIGNPTGGTGFTSGVNGDFVGTATNPIDPKLGPLANNGGRTKTHALLAGSPAIDRGDNANQTPTDQRGPGFPRKKDGNGNGIVSVDIGAFER